MMGSQVLVNGGTGKTDLFTVPNAGNNGFVDVTFGSGGPAATMGNAGIAGRLTARDTLVPKYQAQLDTIAANLISATNTLHTSGFDVNGNAGQPFFTGTNAATISVNTAIQADPSLIAASNTAGASGNNEIALAIIELRTSMSPPLASGTPTSETAYNSLVAGLGTDNRTARNEVNTQEALVDLLAAAPRVALRRLAGRGGDEPAALPARVRGRGAGALDLRRDARQADQRHRHRRAVSNGAGVRPRRRCRPRRR